MRSSRADVLLLDDPLRALDGFARLENRSPARATPLRIDDGRRATPSEDLLEVCDNLSILRDGTLVWSGDTTEAVALASPQYADTVRVRTEASMGWKPVWRF